MKNDVVAIIGLGLSGEAASELLLERGVGVAVFDDRDTPGLRERAARLEARGGRVSLGEKAGEGWSGIREAVVSPGVPLGHPLLERARREGVPAVAEIDLASRYLEGRLIAVTGTNGKTTTVTLLEKILRRAGIPAESGGNIGRPLSRLALESPGCPVVVAEVSSFQLEGISDFRPDTAIFLNLEPDHFDRYPSLSLYGLAKFRIFVNQGPGDRAVFPARLADRLRGAVPSGVEKIACGGEAGVVRVEEGEVRAFFAGGPETICRREELAGRGPAFLENALAAAAAARAEGAAAEDIGAVLCSFPGLPHRLERVSGIGGVEFFNDSKATNPSAALAALAAFDRPVIWLAGGSDKGLDFAPLSDFLPGPVKLAIFFGRTREKLARAAGERVPWRLVSGLEEAVREASRAASAGDVVLLSPACASFDMFADFRERGETFKSLVRGLPARPPGACPRGAKVQGLTSHSLAPPPPGEGAGGGGD